MHQNYVLCVLFGHDIIKLVHACVCMYTCLTLTSIMMIIFIIVILVVTVDNQHYNNIVAVIASFLV